MTNMKRTTVTFGDDLDREIFELRKNENYMRCSYSEIVRRLVRFGLKAEARKKQAKEAS